MVFSIVLDVSASNAYVLYPKVNCSWKPTSLRKRAFVENLENGLIQNYIIR